MSNTPTARALQEETESSHWPHTKRATVIEICYLEQCTGLNMTTPPKMRDLAHRLLTYEAGADKSSEPRESATLRVYEKLRHES